MSLGLARLLDAAPSSLASRLGTHGLAARVLRPLVNLALPESPIVVSVRSGPARGTRLPIYARYEKFYWTGLHERDVQEALATLLRPGMVFWDVGAHIGYHAMLAARLVGPRGRVHAFEPMPANRARLARAAELNTADNVRIDPRAVGIDSGRTVLVRHDASLMWRLGEAGEDGVPVDCISIDHAARELGAPDVIKLDVEGLELRLLGAATELLRNGTAILAETTVAMLEEHAPRHALSVRRIGERHILVRDR